MSPRRLGANVIANLVTAAALLGAALVSVPLILDDIGIEGYGVWAIALTLLVYVTTAEAGVGPAVQRFSAVAVGAGDAPIVRRLLWASLLFYAAVGAVSIAGAVALAPALVDLFGVPRRIAADAEAMFRLTGFAIALALINAAFGNVLQGLERFVAFAASAAVGAVVYLVALIVLLDRGEGLSGLAVAAISQQAAMVLWRAVALRETLLAGPPQLLSRREVGDIARFSLRLQVTVLSTLVNTQTDKVVVGIVANPVALGNVGIGSQIAESGRLVSGAALSPIVSRLSAVHGRGEPGALEALFARLHRMWLTVVIGGTVVGAAVLYPGIEAWLGQGHGEAALFAAFLVVAAGLNLLSGTGIAYLRAVGRPSLEARYGLVLVAANIALTVALGVAFGAIGVVAATTAAYTGGTVWFFARLGAAAPEIQELELGVPVRVVVLALVAGAVAAAAGLVGIELLPAGWSLLPVTAGAGLAFVGFLSAATGRRPTPSELRTLFSYEAGRPL